MSDHNEPTKLRNSESESSANSSYIVNRKKANRPSKNYSDILKEKKKKKLDEIEEVYEELNGFLAHTKMALKSFVYILYFAIKFTLGGLLYRVLFPIIEKILWLVFLVFVFICTMLALVGTKISKFIKKNRSMNPFMNQKNAERLKKLDKIWEFKKFTLVLDMDGTLVYASKVRKLDAPHSIKSDKLIIDIIGEKRSNIYVYPRPHLEEFLSKVGEHFNLVLFTATEQYIADLIIDHVDTWRVIQHRYAKNYCNNIEGSATKDLKRLFPGGLSDVIMIEDAPGTCLQVDNAIRIKRWEADSEKDTTLIDVADFLIENLKKVNHCKDLVDIYNKS